MTIYMQKTRQHPINNCLQPRIADMTCQLLAYLQPDLLKSLPCSFATYANFCFPLHLQAFNCSSAPLFSSLDFGLSVTTYVVKVLKLEKDNWYYY